MIGGPVEYFMETENINVRVAPGHPIDSLLPNASSLRDVSARLGRTFGHAGLLHGRLLDLEPRSIGMQEIMLKIVGADPLPMRSAATMASMITAR